MHTLANTLVLDLSPNLVGQYATQALADLGARVIGVAKPGAAGGAGHSESSTIGRNKESILLDLKHPRGRSLFLDLAARADVVVDGFRPGVADRLGIGPSTLRESYPRLIYCSLSGYGLTGPYAAFPGHDLNYQGVGGMLPLDEDGVPQVATNNWADREGSTNVVLAVLVAMLDRTRSGHGCHIDVGLVDSVVALPAGQRPAGSGYEPTLNGGPPGSEAAGSPAGEILNGTYPWYGVHRCADGKWLTLCAVEPQFWQRFCDHIGRSDWDVQQFSGEPLRTEMFAVIRAVFASQPRDTILAEMLAADIPVAAVNVGDEVSLDTHLRGRGLVIDVELPEGGHVTQIQPAFQVVGSPWAVKRPLTRAGSNTRNVVAEIGVSATEIDELMSSRVIGE